jgi:hypothetical protein
MGLILQTVPRIRGDEPHHNGSYSIDINCSPHPRG